MKFKKMVKISTRFVRTLHKLTTAIIKLIMAIATLRALLYKVVTYWAGN